MANNDLALLHHGATASGVLSFGSVVDYKRKLFENTEPLHFVRVEFPTVVEA